MLKALVKDLKIVFEVSYYYEVDQVFLVGKWYFEVEERAWDSSWQGRFWESYRNQSKYFRVWVTNYTIEQT